MLVGCLAIIGAGIPFVIGLSGYYSKDSILAQALSFAQANPRHAILFYAVAGGAFLTAFYMFRLWFMTFAGAPRDHHVADHAHESPPGDGDAARGARRSRRGRGLDAARADSGSRTCSSSRGPAGTAETPWGGFAFGRP